MAGALARTATDTLLGLGGTPPGTPARHPEHVRP
jgi:hypothetical protein